MATLTSTHEVRELGGKFVILCTVRNEQCGKKLFYIFRYAYDTEKRAREVRENLMKSFGKPKDIETDLAFNYWRIIRSILGAGWTPDYTQRTTQKNSWYIQDPSEARRV